MDIKEKRHRLPKEFYKGEVSAAFTLCLKAGAAASCSRRLQPAPSGFSLREPELMHKFTDILTSVVTETGCIVPVYCFMPDHQHLIIMGTESSSDTWKAIVSYKQKTGFWMAAAKAGIRWQKDFYDHIIRKHEDMAAQVRYLLDNPVRKGLASSWRDYPYKGSIGCVLEDILDGLI